MVLLSFLFIISGSLKLTNAKKQNDYLYKALSTALNNNSQIIIKINNIDKTSIYLPKIIDFVKAKNQVELRKMFDSSKMEILLISNTLLDVKKSKLRRAYHIKNFEKICKTRTSTKRHNGKKYTARWNAVLRCRFSYNGNNYKLGTIYETTVDLNNYFVGVDLNYGNMTYVSTPKAKKLDDYRLKVTASYNLEARSIYLLQDNIDFGRFTEEEIAES